ncbi:hypothetical protein GCM10023194_67250 [Planotetraspora phitsanulokensis]|uniref:DUF4352 domain-containing protein n=1 Tax=Planotetraspora phitsanulokensis TaxID=575192 RepID=A0A8J3XFI0_9ACTN|nr:hypothetical protein [Planotetraspora phitsanulokensis]GII39712.1 hypothetical protein Pph01_47150 [Planotetraspora phitsanulokensis]
MSETPTGGGRPGPGSPDSRDWFAPPLDQPADMDITYTGPPPQPPSIPIPGTLRPVGDLRVWPAPSEEEHTMTVPFPAVPGTRVELPAHYRRPSQAAAPAPPPRTSMSRGKRRALLGSGAFLSVVAAVALPGWFAYGVYQYGRPSDHIHIVKPGQAATWQHVSWKVSLAPIPDPVPSAKPDASRQWMKVVVTRTALDEEGTIRHYPPEVRLTDKSGRLWLAEVVNETTPNEPQANKIGTPYQIDLMGVVPPSVAGQVEVLLRPSISRDVPGQSVADMMKESVTTEEKSDQVLRFVR